MLVMALSVAFLLGILFASQVELSALAIGVVAGLLALAGTSAIRFRRSMRFFFIVLVFLLGLVRVVAFDSDPHSDLLQYHNVESLEVEGVVAVDPEPLETLTRLRISVERVKRDEAWTDASGDNLRMIEIAQQVGNMPVGAVPFNVPFMDDGGHAAHRAAYRHGGVNRGIACHAIPGCIPSQRHPRQPDPFRVH